MSWPLPSGTRWHSSCQNSFQRYMPHNWWTVPHVHTLINGPAVCPIPMHVSILAHLLEEPCQQVPHNFYFKHCSYDTWNPSAFTGFSSYWVSFSLLSCLVLSVLLLWVLFIFSMFSLFFLVSLTLLFVFHSAVFLFFIFYIYLFLHNFLFCFFLCG